MLEPLLFKFTGDVSNAKQDVPVHGNCTYIVKSEKFNWVRKEGIK